MKILVENSTEAPTKIEFSEEFRELNQVLSREARGGEVDYRLAGPIHVTLTHMRSGEDILLSGKLDGKLVGRCARCLEEYPLFISRPFSLVLTPQRLFGREMELSPEALSASFYSGEDIDLSALMQEQVLLDLPSQPLCSDTCRGLCAQCGVNLNQESCDCRPSWSDPRFATLSTLRVSSSGAAK